MYNACPNCNMSGGNVSCPNHITYWYWGTSNTEPHSILPKVTWVPTSGIMKPAKSVMERTKMSKITTCHCAEDGYYSCVELREQLEVARNQIKEAISAFEEHINAVDSARRWYNDSNLWHYDGLDDRIDAAEQRLWILKEKQTS